jgi:hypothetical protein
MTEGAAKKSPDKSRRTAILARVWTVGITGVVLLAGIWFVSVWRTHSVVKNCERIRRFGQPTPEEAIDQLGGQESASVRLKSYLNLHRQLATERTNATFLLGRCGKAVVPALMELLDDNDRSVSEEAAFSLGDMGADGMEAIPALRRKARPIIKAFEAGRDVIKRDPFPELAAYLALKKIRKAESGPESDSESP